MERKVAIHKKAGIIFLFIGIVIFILSLSADFIGLGEWPGYGYKQIAAIILGIVLIALGNMSCKFSKFCNLGEKKD